MKTLFNLHFVKAGLVSKELSAFYSLLLQRRGASDYDVFEVVEEEDVQPLLTTAEVFIATLTKLTNTPELE